MLPPLSALPPLLPLSALPPLLPLSALPPVLPLSALPPVLPLSVLPPALPLSVLPPALPLSVLPPLLPLSVLPPLLPLSVVPLLLPLSVLPPVLPLSVLPLLLDPAVLSLPVVSPPCVLPAAEVAPPDWVPPPAPPPADGELARLPKPAARLDVLPADPPRPARPAAVSRVLLRVVATPAGAGAPRPTAGLAGACGFPGAWTAGFSRRTTCPAAARDDAPEPGFGSTMSRRTSPVVRSRMISRRYSGLSASMRIRPSQVRFTSRIVYPSACNSWATSCSGPDAAGMAMPNSRQSSRPPKAVQRDMATSRP